MGAYLSQARPRLVKVLAGNDHRLRLTYDSGEERIFDFKPLLGLTCFKPLANIGFFKIVRLEYGSVAWPLDIDYCPDTLYAESVPTEAMPTPAPRPDAAG